ANDGRVLGCNSIGGRSKVKARPGAHLLLRRVGRIRVHFAGNGLARFRCLTAVEFFISSATAKGNHSAGEEREIAPFHGKITSARRRLVKLKSFRWYANGFRKGSCKF